MDRYLLIRVVLTQSPFAQVFDVLLDALRLDAEVPAATCRSVGKCDRKTLPFVHIRKSARTGLTGRPLKYICKPKGRHPL